MFAAQKHTRFVRGLLAIFCAAQLVAVTHGAEVLLSGFETDMSSSIPGVSWTVPAGSTMTTEIVSGIPGTTEGSSVLKLEHAGIWSGDPFIVLSGQDVAREISESTALKFDLIAPPELSWRQAFVILHGSPVDWNTTQTQFDLNTGPESPYTVEYDLTQPFTDTSGNTRPLNEIAQDAFDEPSDWFQLVIVFQGQNQGDPPPERSISYIDNIRLVQPDVVGVDGDYNNDGSVDAADYVVWRAHEGEPAGTLPNDPTGSPIGPDQYNVWTQNFGGGGAGGSLSAAAVPEPGTLALSSLLVVGFGVLNARSSRKR
jgi:hypothetical protein